MSESFWDMFEKSNLQAKDFKSELVRWKHSANSDFLAWGIQNENESRKILEKLIERLLHEDPPSYWDAKVCTLIACWRSDEILQIMKQNEIYEDAQVSLFDMLSIIRSRIEKIQREPEWYITIRNYISTYIPPHE